MSTPWLSPKNEVQGESVCMANKNLKLIQKMFGIKEENTIKKGYGPIPKKINRINSQRIN